MKKALASGLVAFVLLGMVSTWLLLQFDRQMQTNRQGQNLESFAAEIETKFFLRHQAELSWLASQEAIQRFLASGGSPSTALTSILEQVRGLVGLDVVYLVDAKGKITVSSDPTYLGTDVSFREYFQEAKAGRTRYSLAVGLVRKTPGLYAAVPVFVDGRVVGVASFRTSASQLDLALAANPGIFLLDPNGREFSSDPNLVRNSSTWIWDGPSRVLASGHWNRVIRHPLGAVSGFSLVSLEPENWPWVTVCILNLICALLVVTGVSVWHQSQLARERRAEQRSRHERELLLANLLEGIAVLDTEGKLLWANPAFQRLVQTDSAETSQSMKDWWETPGEVPWAEVFEGKRPWVVFEGVFRGRQGSWTPVLAGLTAAEGQFLLSVLDRSESHRSDQLLRQSQKLTVLGQLSGGIAHDLNNILGVLMGMADLIKMTLAEEDPLQESVDLMLQTLTRAATLAERMLDFARQTPVNRVPIDLTALLRELLFLSRTALPPSVVASFEIP